MNADRLRGKILRVEQLSPTWLKHGGDEQVIVDTMQSVLTLVKQQDITQAEQLLDQLIKILGTDPSVGVGRGR